MYVDRIDVVSKIVHLGGAKKKKDVRIPPGIVYCHMPVTVWTNRYIESVPRIILLRL